MIRKTSTWSNTYCDSQEKCNCLVEVSELQGCCSQGTLDRMIFFNQKDFGRCSRIKIKQSWKLNEVTLQGTSISHPKALLSRWFSMSQGGICDRSLDGKWSIHISHSFTSINQWNWSLGNRSSIKAFFCRRLRNWSVTHSANGPWKKKFELYFPY